MTSAPDSPRLGVLRASFLVFAASCATLVLELVADRLLAPFVGVSLYTWTSIIGVVLAGISVGSWAGGKLADRRPDLRVVTVLFIAGSLTSLLSLGLARALGDGTALRVLPVLPRTFLLTFLGFFPASFVLAMVTPATLKLLLPDLQRAGRTAGLVYAMGTVGSIAGSMLTGLVLVARYPVPTIILGVVGALLVVGLLTLPGRVTLAPAPAETPASSVPDAARAAPTDKLDLRHNALFATVLVTCASFCMMIVEVGASRLMSPIFGVSVFTWTCILTVVMAGIALGNLLGGRIADRWPRQEVLAASLFVTGLICFSIPLVIRELIDTLPFGDLPRVQRVALYTSAVFLLPVTALGTLSPQVLKLVLTDMDHAGRTAGRLYAWSTAGAILGTFLTGWFLIARVGVTYLVVAAGVGLVTLAFLAGRAWRRPRFFGATVGTLGLVGSFVYLDAFSFICTVETDYFCIRVTEEVTNGRKVREMQLDNLTHTSTVLDDPAYFGYPHLYLQSDFIRWAAARSEEPRTLIIGGGGYAIPRWIENFVPKMRTEVVEIDPVVTRIALDHFGMKKDTRVISYNLDGRQFIQEQAQPGAYDLIIQDAVNNLSVPYHLMTREYDAHVKTLLKPGGVYLLTIIDHVPRGSFLRSAVKTMREAFPEVKLLRPASMPEAGWQIYVVAGSTQPLDLAELETLVKAQGGERTHTAAFTEAQLQAYFDAGQSVVMTDDYAPVDHLLSGLILSR
ncbi:fused MFS/spermidine synthase [Myxococcaceae bacterium GXIMD 01537]